MEGVDTVWGEEDNDGMLACIKALFEEQPRPVLLAGHSLGAALATIAGARLAAVHDIPIHGVYTIGSPRLVVVALLVLRALPFGAVIAPRWSFVVDVRLAVRRGCQGVRTNGASMMDFNVVASPLLGRAWCAMLVLCRASDRDAMKVRFVAYQICGEIIGRLFSPL